MNQRDAILCALAARYAPHERFAKSDIVVVAWEHAPQAFGLAGYTHLPDANRVLCKLYGSSGVIKMGHVVAEGAGYRVTPEGYLAARFLNTGAAHAQPPEAP